MKLRALIFLFIIGGLTMQPLFGSRQATVNRQCCSKTKCRMAKHPEDKKDDCADKTCNPFLACAYGNYFLQEHNNTTFVSILPQKQINIIRNDNRIIKNSSGCWHPPRNA